MSEDADLTQQDLDPDPTSGTPRFNRRQMLFSAASAAAAAALGGVVRAQMPAESFFRPQVTPSGRLR